MKENKDILKNIHPKKRVEIDDSYFDNLTSNIIVNSGISHPKIVQPVFKRKVFWVASVAAVFIVILITRSIDYKASNDLSFRSVSKPELFAYVDNNIEDFEKQMQRAEKMIEKSGGGILVITEGVFGMDGEQGIIKEIVATKQKYQFRLLIDDAHGFGYMGPTGAGADEAQGCQAGVDLYFSTFVKSMGSIGAFISGPKAVMKYLRYNTRSQIFAKSLPLMIVEGMLTRMEMVTTMPQLREKLWYNVNRLQNGLRERGFDIGNTNTPVTPIYMKGDVPEATQMVMDLRENYHVFCSIVVYPVIPKGDIIYRLIPTASHTDEDIDITLKAFEATKKKLDAGEYKATDIPNMADANV